ncbi:hypothetical protein ACWDKQ_31930 [Saccharopolyspora sp. NPDC000995]
MAADFPSFDWHDRDLGDEALRQAHAELMEPTDLDVYLRAFSSMRATPPPQPSRSTTSSTPAGG